MIERRSPQNIAKRAVIIFLLALMAFLQLFSFYLQLVNALQPLDLVPVYGKIYLIPDQFTWNFTEAIVRLELLQGMGNSLIVALGFTFLSSLVILLMGYVLGKKRFHGKKIIKFCMLVTMVVPGEILLVSNYLLVSQFNWINNYAGLILPGIVNVMGIFLVMSFMNTIPDSLLESADLDGANELIKIFCIVLPLCLPVLATYWILTVVSQWNDYLWPMIVVNDRDLFTVQLKLKEVNPYYTGFADEVLKSAAHIISIVPIFVIYILCQKQFIGGISVTGLK